MRHTYLTDCEVVWLLSLKNSKHKHDLSFLKGSLSFLVGNTNKVQVTA